MVDSVDLVLQHGKKWG